MREIEQIYRAYKDDVYRYLCGLTHDPVQAEDLLSETFLHAAGAGHVPRRRHAENVAVHDCLARVDRRAAPQKALSFVRRPVGAVPAGRAVHDPLRVEVDTRDLAARARALLRTRKPLAGTSCCCARRVIRSARSPSAAGISESSARTLDFRTRTWLREALQKEEKPRTGG